MDTDFDFVTFTRYRTGTKFSIKASGIYKVVDAVDKEGREFRTIYYETPSDKCDWIEVSEETLIILQDIKYALARCRKSYGSKEQQRESALTRAVDMEE